MPFHVDGLCVKRSILEPMNDEVEPIFALFAREQ